MQQIADSESRRHVSRFKALSHYIRPLLLPSSTILFPLLYALPSLLFRSIFIPLTSLFYSNRSPYLFPRFLYALFYLFSLSHLSGRSTFSFFFFLSLFLQFLLLFCSTSSLIFGKNKNSCCLIYNVLRSLSFDSPPLFPHLSRRSWSHHWLALTYEAIAFRRLNLLAAVAIYLLSYLSRHRTIYYPLQVIYLLRIRWGPEE